LDGNSDYITFPDNASWDFGTGDFTIDFWVRIANVSTHQGFIGHTGDFAGDYGWWMYYNKDDFSLHFTYSTDGTALAEILASDCELSVDTWYHIAVTRNGVNGKIFVNGVQKGLTKDMGSASIFSPSVTLRVGYDYYDNLYTNGYIDELHIYKGVAKYTANFTPETAAYTTDDWNAPDGWAMNGASATVAREATIVKVDTYSAAVTRNGTNCYLAPLTYATPPKGYLYYRGRTVTAGCFVYATVANRARIVIQDGVSASVNSSYHTGDSTWQWLTVTATLPSNSTQLYMACEVNTGNTTAYFDGAMLVEGSSAFAFSPKPAEEGVWADYSATSTIVGWSSFSTKAIYTKKIGKMVFVTFVLSGTSNATNATFTVPYTSSNTIVTFFSTSHLIDNGSPVNTGANGTLSNNTATVTLYKDGYSGAWTNANNKQVTGQFFYEAA